MVNVIVPPMFQLCLYIVEAGDVSVWIEMTHLFETNKYSLADNILRCILSITEAITGYLPHMYSVQSNPIQSNLIQFQKSISGNKPPGTE
jgi:hypothetical protein